MFSAVYLLTARWKHIDETQVRRMKKIELDAEVADGIALAVLKEQRDYLKKELAKWKKNPKSDVNPTGYWLHPDDVVGNAQLITALDTIIAYFGG